HRRGPIRVIRNARPSGQAWCLRFICVMNPKSETVRKCTRSREGAASGECKRGKEERARVLAGGGGEDERWGERAGSGRRTGCKCARAVSLAGATGGQG